MSNVYPYSALQLHLMGSLEALRPLTGEINHYIDLIRVTYIPENHYPQVLGFIFLLLHAMPEIKTNPNDIKLNLLWQHCEAQLVQQTPSSSPFGKQPPSL